MQLEAETFFHMSRVSCTLSRVQLSRYVFQSEANMMSIKLSIQTSELKEHRTELKHFMASKTTELKVKNGTINRGFISRMMQLFGVGSKSFRF